MMRIINSRCVLSDKDCERNLHKALARNLPYCVEQPERTDKLAVVAAGPSVKDFLDEIRQFEHIWAINGAYNYLLDQGIVPSGFLGSDPLPGLAEYVLDANTDTKFYISALCDESVFDALSDYNVNVWFPDGGEEREYLELPPGAEAIQGGSTALTRAPFLGKYLGFRDITLFGADSSFNGKRYVYPTDTYAEDSKAANISAVKINGEGPFLTETALLMQVSQLGVIYSHQTWGVKLHIRCHGLMDAYIRAPMETDAEEDIARFVKDEDRAVAIR